MQKIMKLTIVALIFVAIIIAAPFGMGILSEKEMHKKMKEFQVKLAAYPNVEYKLLSYKRGFFSSEAVERVTFKNLKINGKEIGPIEMSLVDEIKHGPFILEKDKEGRLSLWVGRASIKSKLKKVISDGEVSPLPLDLYSAYVGFKGDMKVFVELNKLLLDFPTFTLVFENLRNLFECSYDRKKINNQLGLKHVVFTDKIKPQKFDLKGLDVVTDLTKNNQGLWLGSRKMEMESLVASVEGKTYQIKGLYKKIKDIEHDKQVKFELVLNVKNAGVDDKLYGPHRLVLEMDGMDASVFSKVSRALVNLDHQSLGLTNTSGTPESQELIKDQVLMNKLSDLAADLIKKGFSIQIKNLEIATKWGIFSANSHFKIPSLGVQQQGIPQLSLLSSVLNMESTVNAQIPVGLAKSIVESRYRRMLESQNQSILPEQQNQTQNLDELAEKHLAKLVADGWFIPRGEGPQTTYDIRLSFRKGQFLVNDKPLKPQGILPEIAPAPVAPMMLPQESAEVASPIDATSSPAAKNIKPSDDVKPAESAMPQATGEIKKPVEGIKSEEQTKEKLEGNNVAPTPATTPAVKDTTDTGTP